ncbi:hydroxysteroid 11-beta-dehydrogenase 1-like protein isoform X3 [Pithys albifrons albifrons]
MSFPSEPEKVVQFALQKLGGLDYLVLNHIGRTRFQMWTGDVEYTRWLMQVNFFSYVELTTAALPTLEQSRGSLVVVSSVAGKIPTPFTTSYSATKFALDGFFSSLRHELTMQKSNVSITLCILGLIDTEAALENTRCVLGGGCRSLGGSVAAGIQLFLKAYNKIHHNGVKGECESLWLCKKMSGFVHIHLSTGHEHAEPCGSRSAQCEPHQGLAGFDALTSEMLFLLAGAKCTSGQRPLPRPPSPSSAEGPRGHTRSSTPGGCTRCAASGFCPPATGARF